MSGGGGSGGGGAYSGGGPPDEPYDCNKLRFEATINSPDPTVVATLTAGDTLEVTLEGPPTRRVVVAAPSGTLGSLVDHLPRLIYCLQQRAFGATVVLIVGVVVRVNVQPL